MTNTPDPDGVDREDTSAELHENTRSSEEGVERAPETAEDRKPATGLIGNNAGVDPRYIGQR